MEEIITHSEDDTAALAARLARNIRPGQAVLLQGGLGAGKTVFARALIRALCGDPALDVPSPTFTLVQTYETPRFMLWHFDLYRLEKPDDVFELGWEDACAGDSVALIEWPERLGDLREDLCPASALAVSFETQAGTTRRIKVLGLEKSLAPV